jgi:hypothetical protein
VNARDDARDVLAGQAERLAAVRPDGHVHRLEPAGQETIGKAKGFGQEMRECVYLPKLDLVGLFRRFSGVSAAIATLAANAFTRDARSRGASAIVRIAGPMRAGVDRKAISYHYAQTERG